MTTTQQTTIHTTGLGTIDNWSPELLPQASCNSHYDYWKDFSNQAIPQLGFEVPQAYLGQYTEMAAHAKAVSEIIEDPSGISELREIHKGGQVGVFSTAIKHWSDEFGNFNNRTDAKDTFIKAAELVIQEQIEAWGGQQSTFETPLKPENISLGALVRLIGTIPYEGIRYMLLVGELVHKSAWLEKADPEEQSRKFNLALDMYRRVIKASRAEKLDNSPDAIKAMEYSIDIKFYLAQRRHQEAIRYGKSDDVISATNTMRQLIANEASQVLSIMNQSWNSNAKYHNLGGATAERFMPLLIRDSILNSIHNGESVDSEFFSVRGVFKHEDVSPPSRNIPKSGFDMVMQRCIGDDQVVTTPVQIKRSSRLVDDSVDMYLPGIVIVTSNGVTITGIKQAIEALKNKYSRNGNKDVICSMNEVNGLRRRLAENLLAA